MAFEIFIFRLHCTFERPVAMGRTLQVKVLSRVFPDALREVSCDMPALDCRACPRAASCAHAVLLAPRAHDGVHGIPYIEDAAAPFALRPVERGAVRRWFDVVLAGDAIPHAAVVVSAFARMGREGLGRERNRFSLTACRALDAAFEPRARELTPARAGALLDIPPIGLDKAVGDVSIAAMKTAALRFVTPPLLRPGKAEPRPQFGLLARRLRDRIRVVGTLHGGGEPGITLKGLAAKAEEVGFDRTPRGAARGEAAYAGPLHDFVPLLRLGSYLNVGQWCAFGQGWYEIIHRP